MTQRGRFARQGPAEQQNSDLAESISAEGPSDVEQLVAHHLLYNF
jgi:hypothetical protein